jgi:hypothetical protein
MGQVQNIYEKYQGQGDVLSNPAVHEEMSRVPELQLYHYLSYNPESQSHGWKIQTAMARSELDRRNFAQHKKLSFTITILSGVLGIIGTVVGVLLGMAL